HTAAHVVCLRGTLACYSCTALLTLCPPFISFFFFQAEDGIRDPLVTGVQTCALPISRRSCRRRSSSGGRSPSRRRGSARGPIPRSEERRVGKECRSRGWPEHEKKKERRMRQQLRLRDEQDR